MRTEVIIYDDAQRKTPILVSSYRAGRRFVHCTGINGEHFTIPVARVFWIAQYPPEAVV